jgi:hypothetical protein
VIDVEDEMHLSTRISRKLVVVAALVVALIGTAAQVALAVPGDRIAEVITVEGTGATWARGISVSVGFDGQHLYYTEYGGSILHRVDVPPAGGPVAATGQVDVPITGVPSGIMSIAYDAGRGVFWAVGSDMLSIYTITKGGAATLRFSVDPTVDRPGYTATIEEVKLAYDRSDDTIWYNPDATSRIYHYRTAADALGTAQLVTATPFIDVNVAPNDVGAQCGFNQSSGVAVGGANLIISVAGCPYFFEFTKAGVKVAWHPMTNLASGDLECDDVSYAVDVVWLKDTWEGRIQAYELPTGACAYGGGPAAP